MRTPFSRVVYPEVDACETLLKYRTYDAGGCKVRRQRQKKRKAPEQRKEAALGFQ